MVEKIISERKKSRILNIQRIIRGGILIAVLSGAGMYLWHTHQEAQKLEMLSNARSLYGLVRDIKHHDDRYSINELSLPPKYWDDDFSGFHFAERSNDFPGFHDAYRTKEGFYVITLGASCYLVSHDGRMITQGGHHILLKGGKLFTGYGTNVDIAKPPTVDDLNEALRRKGKLQISTLNKLAASGELETILLNSKFFFDQFLLPIEDSYSRIHRLLACGEIAIGNGGYFYPKIIYLKK